jgi:hypothetical protein
MKKYFQTGQFAASLSVFVCAASMTACNAPRIAREADAGILFAVFGVITVLSAVLTWLAWKEFKHD